MQTESPTTSIIMNCFNSEKYLREAIDSAYAQTCEDWEIVFWDNASTDGSSEIARSYDERVRYFRGEKTIPLGAARNRAIEKSRGEFITFLDCDDLWMPEKLEKQIPLFEKDSRTGLVFSDAIYFSDAGKRVQLYGKKTPPRGNIFPYLLKHYFLCMGTVAIRRSALVQIGEWFDERLSMTEEEDVFMRVAYTWKSDYADEPLMMYRMHENSVTSQSSVEIPKELELILEKILQLDPCMELKYRHELSVMRANIEYEYAMVSFRLNQRKETRRRLGPHLVLEKKLLLPYLFSFFPFGFYRFFLQRFYRFGCRC